MVVQLVAAFGRDFLLTALNFRIKKFFHSGRTPRTTRWSWCFAFVQLEHGFARPK